MKILHITAQKPHSTGSGVYMTELIHSFSNLGIEQKVVAGVSPEDSVYFPESVQFCPVTYMTEELPFPILGMSDEMPYTSTRYNQLTVEMARAFQQAFLSRIQVIIEQFQPDTIFCHHLYLLTAFLREAFPVAKIYGFCHGTDLRQIKKTSFLREYIIEQIQNLDGFFALHEPQRLDICQTFQVDPSKVQVIGSGYNHHIFYPAPTLVEKKPTDTRHIIFAGKLCQKKGVQSLLRGMNHLVLPFPVELSLAGGLGVASELAQIKELASQCSHPVHFLGKLNHEELATALRVSDLFVLPSFFEGLPLVIMEALACGAKVICNDLPGISLWVEERIPNHGILFPSPPPMEKIDEPDPAFLPDYEQLLARTIEEALLSTQKKQADLSQVTWDGLARYILDLVQL
ncbi:MAG: glycosyltransferase family 4 protein [Lachnospiraceae bacterium]|nr:glycosyltransferase family 4 protein [Lachnospiraceae bacterium]